MLVDAILIGLASVVYVIILQEPGMILNKYSNYLDSLGCNWRYFTYPFALCERCNSGQIALWAYLYYNWYNYDLLQHIFYVSIAIFSSVIFKFIYFKIDK